MSRRLAILAAVALTVVVGCGTPEGVQGPTRNEAAGVDPNARPVRARETRSSWARDPEPGPTPLDVVPPPAPDIVIEEPGPAPPAPPPVVRPRNFGEDLRVAIGDVSGCLDVQTAAALRGSLSISVSATALPSGTLQRASVSAGSLPRPVLDCIRQRVESASLQTPIEGAPRTVSTTLRYTVSAEVTTETVTRFATDGPPPGRTRAPGAVLPALGEPGPAPGAQAPAVVLPDLAPAGPAPGYVAPGHTLPAQGAPSRR